MEPCSIKWRGAQPADEGAARKKCEARRRDRRRPEVFSETCESRKKPLQTKHERNGYNACAAAAQRDRVLGRDTARLGKDDENIARPQPTARCLTIANAMCEAASVICVCVRGCWLARSPRARCADENAQKRDLGGGASPLLRSAAPDLAPAALGRTTRIVAGPLASSEGSLPSTIFSPKS